MSDTSILISALESAPGVEGLSNGFIKFIGVSEILGSIGAILPQLLDIYPILTPISLFCLASIMIPAGVIHYRRNELKNVALNTIIFIVCLSVAYFRL